MKTLLAYSLALVVTGLSLSSCKTEGCTDSKALNYNSSAQKDDGSCDYASTPDLSIESTPTYSFLVDGVLNVHPGGYNIFPGSGYSGSIGAYSDLVWSTSFDDNVKQYGIIQITKGVQTFQTGYYTDSLLSSYFIPSYYSYATSGDTGIVVSIGDESGNYYYSNLGPQSNASFEIFDAKDEQFPNGFYVKVHLKFSCKVYNENDLSDVKTITNGELVGHFGGY